MFLASAAWATVVLCAAQASAQPEFERPPQSFTRIVHEFDFLEPDNLTPLPKYWVPHLSDAAFPRYTEGHRDMYVGHNEAPSFYLDSMGRNVAYRYLGTDTRIRPGDYLIMGWIKPANLHYSRATMSAYYLDAQGNPIEGSQRFAALIGSQYIEASAEPWQRVEIRLPASPPNAYAVGLSCWVVQQAVWREGLMPHRHIAEVDVHGGAWFDDIAVHRLPHVRLNAANPGNIFVSPTKSTILATVADVDTNGLTADLIISNTDRQPVFSEPVPVFDIEDQRSVAVEVGDLMPGLYYAKLRVFTQGELLINQDLTFAVLGPSQRRRNVVARQMGVIVDSAAIDTTDDEIALIEALGIGIAKLPIWTKDSEHSGFDEHRDLLREMLDKLFRIGVSVVGVFSGPPAELVRSVGIHARSLLDILGDDPKGWSMYLDAVVAPYASIFQSWQIGGDGDRTFIDDPRMSNSYSILRRAMSDMVASPNLTAVASAAEWPAEQSIPAENLTVELPSDIEPEFIDEHLTPFRNLKYDRLWVSIPLPDAQGVDRKANLTDWALRIIETRWSGVDAVFVPQLWRTRSTLYGTTTEPSEAYVIYRTIADTIGDAIPAERFKLGTTGNAISFTTGDRSVLVLWDTLAPAGGCEYTLQLGAATGAIDLWGRPVEMRRISDGRCNLTLSHVPVFVTGVERWLVAFRAGLQLNPKRVDFTYAAREHMLSLTNQGHNPIAGTVNLIVPEQWELEPRNMRFGLQPQQTREFGINIRYAHNESAGTKQIRAAVKMLTEPKYFFEIPLEFEMSLRDVDVWGYAFREGSWLVVRHGVTNRSSDTLSFRTFATYPGRSRQYRVINELLPDQTITAEYRFANVKEGSERTIRLGLREVNGPRIHNLEITSP